MLTLCSGQVESLVGRGAAGRGAGACPTISRGWISVLSDSVLLFADRCRRGEESARERGRPSIAMDTRLCG